MTKDIGTKIGIAAVVLGVIGVGATVVLAMKKPKTTTTTIPGGINTSGSTSGGHYTSSGSGSSSSSSGSSSGTKSSGSSSQFPLKMGSRDSSTGYGSVIRLQNALNGLGKGLVADGIFGSKTQAALQSVTGKTTVGSESELAAIEAMQYPTVVAPAPYDFTQLFSPTPLDLSSYSSMTGNGGWL